jgi:hypothetical protein
VFRYLYKVVINNKKSQVGDYSYFKPFGIICKVVFLSGAKTTIFLAPTMVII